MGRRPEGKAENALKNLGKKLDEFVEEIKSMADDPKYKSRIDELKRNGEKLKGEFEEFRVKHQDAFDQVEDTFEKAGDQIRKAFDQAFTKSDGKKDNQ